MESDSRGVCSGANAQRGTLNNRAQAAARVRNQADSANTASAGRKGRQSQCQKVCSGKYARDKSNAASVAQAVLIAGQREMTAGQTTLMTLLEENYWGSSRLFWQLESHDSSDLGWVIQDWLVARPFSHSMGGLILAIQSVVVVLMMAWASSAC